MKYNMKHTRRQILEAIKHWTNILDEMRFVNEGNDNLAFADKMIEDFANKQKQVLEFYKWVFDTAYTTDGNDDIIIKCRDIPANIKQQYEQFLKNGNYINPGFICIRRKKDKYCFMNTEMSIVTIEGHKYGRYQLVEGIQLIEFMPLFILTPDIIKKLNKAARVENKEYQIFFKAIASKIEPFFLKLGYACVNDIINLIRKITNEIYDKLVVGIKKRRNQQLVDKSIKMKHDIQKARRLFAVKSKKYLDMDPKDIDVSNEMGNDTLSDQFNEFLNVVCNAIDYIDFDEYAEYVFGELYDEYDGYRSSGYEFSFDKFAEEYVKEDIYNYIANHVSSIIPAGTQQKFKQNAENALDKAVDEVIKKINSDNSSDYGSWNEIQEPPDYWE